MANALPPIPDDMKLKPLPAKPAPGSPAAKAPDGQGKDAAAAGGPPPEEAVHPMLNFWQQKWVQEVLPFCTSLFIHAAVLILGIMLIPKVVNFVFKNDTVNESTIPESTDQVPGTEDGNLGIPHPGLGGDPNREAAQNVDPTSTSHGWLDHKSPNPTPETGGGGGEGDDIIGSGPGNGPGHGTGTGGGNGTGIGIGNGEGGGDQAMYGIPGGGGGIGPRGKLFGHTGGVKSVIFVCDASGSMMGNKIDVLRIELKKSIGGLQPVQAFNVVFFQDPSGEVKTPYADMGSALLMGNPVNKTKATDFLDNITVHGSTNPLPALDEAFKQHPQLVYLLTDGEFDDPAPEQVIAKIADLNKNKSTKVNTILFLGSRKEIDENKDAEQTMKKIADDNGGVFNEFYSDEL